MCQVLYDLVYRLLSRNSEVDGADGPIFTDADMEAFRVAAQGRLTELGIPLQASASHALALLHETGPPRSLQGRLNVRLQNGWKRGTGLWVHLL